MLSSGETALTKASDRRFIETVKLLLDAQLDLDFDNDNSMAAALSGAQILGNVSMTEELLLSYGDAVEVIMKSGTNHNLYFKRKALLAPFLGHKETGAKSLLDGGARVYIASTNRLVKRPKTVWDRRGHDNTIETGFCAFVLDLLFHNKGIAAAPIYAHLFQSAVDHATSCYKADTGPLQLMMDQVCWALFVDSEDKVVFSVSDTDKTLCKDLRLHLDWNIDGVGLESKSRGMEKALYNASMRGHVTVVRFLLAFESVLLRPGLDLKPFMRNLRPDCQPRILLLAFQKRIDERAEKDKKVGQSPAELRRV